MNCLSTVLCNITCHCASVNLMMVAQCSSKLSLITFQATQLHNPLTHPAARIRKLTNLNYTGSRNMIFPFCCFIRVFLPQSTF